MTLMPLRLPGPSAPLLPSLPSRLRGPEATTKPPRGHETEGPGNCSPKLHAVRPLQRAQIRLMCK